MPYLFAMDIHDTLAEAKRTVYADENMFTFLEDIYISTPDPKRRKLIYDLSESALFRRIEIRLNDSSGAG